MRIAAGTLLLTVLLFGAFELRRWRQPEFADALSKQQKGRRILGLALLASVLGMGYAGSYFPGPPISKGFAELEILYWLVCLLIAVFIPLVAFLELKDSLRRSTELRRKLYSEIVTAPLQSLDNAPSNGHHPTPAPAPFPGKSE